MTLASTVAHAQDRLSNQTAGGIIVSAVRWLQGTLLGTVATVTALIAVATVGFSMLTGRIPWHYGATVILACFILFGAANIVAGIRSTAQLGQILHGCESTGDAMTCSRTGSRSAGLDGDRPKSWSRD